MSDLGGAILLSQQLEAYRWEDQARRISENKALSANDAAWRNQYNDLLNRYNRLVHDANRLADAQDRTLNGQDKHIAELKATNARLEATNADLKAQVHKLTIELTDVQATVKLLQSSLRELRPGAYRSIYDED